MDSYDIVIIGAGPIGLTIAIEAQKAKLSHLVIEKGVLVNSLYNFPKKMKFFSTSKLLETGAVPFISHDDKPSREEALEYYYRVQDHWSLNIKYQECVLEIENKDEAVIVSSSKNKYLAKSVVLATGFYDVPNPLNVPGDDLEKVSHYYRDAHPYIDQKVVVVGAANSACDTALELYQKGAEVTMVIRAKEINPRVKYWIKPNIENRIKEGKIKAYFESRITAIHSDKVDLQSPSGNLSLENDYILAMTGYRPNYAMLKKWDIDLRDDEAKTPQYNPITHLSSRSNIYLAGVLCGGLKTNTFFIENAMDHAEKIIKHISSKIKL